MHTSLEDKLRAIKMCKTMHVSDVAQEFGVHPDTVRDWKNGQGMKRSLAQSKLEKKMKPKVIKLYEKYGLGSATQVSKELGISLRCVKKWLKVEGYELTLTHPESYRKEARRLYKKFGSIYKVGKEMNLDHGVIHKWVSDLVPPERKKRKFSSKEINKALQMRRDGYTLSQISNEIGAYVPTVIYWIKKGYDKEYKEEEK